MSRAIAGVGRFEEARSLGRCLGSVHAAKVLQARAVLLALARELPALRPPAEPLLPIAKTGAVASPPADASDRRAARPGRRHGDHEK